MTAQGISVQRRGAVAIVSFDRPDRRNALDQPAWNRLGQVADELAADLPRAVVLTGAGDIAFCAGMDLSPDNPQIAGLISAVQNQEPGPVAEMLGQLHSVLDRLFGLPVPLIAAVNGLAYGGGAEIAARCDLRVLADTAVVCFSEVRLGLMPDLGGGVALTRLLGPGRASDLILTARKVKADEALALGFANRVAPAASCLQTAIELADTIAKNGPRAVRAALRVIRESSSQPMAVAISAEVEAAVGLIASGECSHGIAAFMSGSEPSFPDPAD